MENGYRHMSSGSLNIPPAVINGVAGGPPQPSAAAGRFDGPRSPPGRQNTSHVPCKFFRQGTCQAGSACPFSHDLASTTDNVCKYFAKGNCKFGPKCANIHVLPDGRRVNYHKGSMGGPGHLNIGGRMSTDLYHAQSNGSALTRGFMGTNNGIPPTSYGYGAYQEDGFPPLAARQGSIDITVPTIDTSYASRPGSQYGSPRDGDLNRFGFGLSPGNGRGLSVLDAQLPDSFDSQGVSWIARNGPIASSVPSKFGLESPPGSLRNGEASETLKNLHSSVFGDDTRDRFNGIPSSPPAQPAEEYFGKRMMHSQRSVKKGVMSASLPKAVDRDWDTTFTFEEDLLPENLKDLLTPVEKARRGSRNAEDEGRPINSGTGTPNESKFGSPSNASPSRWGPLFQRHQQEKDEQDRARISAFGHVGSPLRNSTLHAGASPSSRSVARPSASGDSSPYLASPPRQSSTSIISQQLQRTRLSRTESNGSDTGLHPSRAVSNPIGSSRMGDRQISSSSIGGSGRFTTPIDEEQGEFVFNMDGMEDLDERGEKRNSGGWAYGSGRSPNLGAIGGRNGTTNGNNLASTGLDGMFGAR